MFRPVFCVLVSLLWFTLPAKAGDAWTEDFAAAKAQAQKEHKDLLLDFTGSDWCIWCKRLHAEVLNLDEFQTEAQKHFVLVELDYPRAKAQLAATRKQNDELRREFAIEEYPSLYLTDAKGRPYARASYAPGGPAPYLQNLEKLRAQKQSRDEAMAKADKATGLERAKLLDAALSTLNSDGVRVGYGDVMQEIQALDKDNSAGLKKKYEIIQKYNAIASSMNSNDMDGLLVKAEDLLKETDPALTSENRQDLYFLKANILATKKQMPAAIQALNQAKIAAPDTPKAKMIDQILARVAAQAAQAAQTSQPAKPAAPAPSVPPAPPAK